jgi:hypothetical protein
MAPNGEGVSGVAGSGASVWRWLRVGAEWKAMRRVGGTHDRSVRPEKAGLMEPEKEFVDRVSFLRASKQQGSRHAHIHPHSTTETTAGHMDYNWCTVPWRLEGGGEQPCTREQ